MSFECFLFFTSSNAARDPVPFDGSLVRKAHSPYDLVLAMVRVSMFVSDDDISGRAGVYTFKSSDR